MASDAETRAKEAFIDDHFELAVDLYSQAISMDPKNAELFADRSQANIKLRNFTGLPLSLPLSRTNRYTRRHLLSSSVRLLIKKRLVFLVECVFVCRNCKIHSQPARGLDFVQLKFSFSEGSNNGIQ